MSRIPFSARFVLAGALAVLPAVAVAATTPFGAGRSVAGESAERRPVLGLGPQTLLDLRRWWWLMSARALPWSVQQERCPRVPLPVRAGARDTAPEDARRSGRAPVLQGQGVRHPGRRAPPLRASRQSSSRGRHCSARRFCTCGGAGS